MNGFNGRQGRAFVAAPSNFVTNIYNFFYTLPDKTSEDGMTKGFGFGQTEQDFSGFYPPGPRCEDNVDRYFA